MNLDDIKGLATISVPEAGEVLGIGRDAAYDAAKRGDIPTLKLGRALRVPVPKLLAMLGEPVGYICLDHEGVERGIAEALRDRSLSLPE